MCYRKSLFFGCGLDTNHINTPITVQFRMRLKIGLSGSQNVGLFARCDRDLWWPKRRRQAGFNFNKNQHPVICKGGIRCALFGNQVDFSEWRSLIALQDSVTLLFKITRRPNFSVAARFCSRVYRNLQRSIRRVILTRNPFG